MMVMENKKIYIETADFESQRRRIISVLEAANPLSEGDLRLLTSLFRGGGAGRSQCQTSYVFFKGTCKLSRELRAKNGRVIRSKKEADPNKVGVYRITAQGCSKIIEADSIDELLSELTHGYSEGIIELNIISC